MPRPRFEKLAPDKRERILEAAAQAFAGSGFEGASLNQILDAAGISKGAAYYYFDDKADLFSSVVLHYFGEFFERPLEQVFGAGSADVFWGELADYCRTVMARLAHRPWMLGLMRSLWRLSPELRAAGPLKPLFDTGQGWLQQLVHKGRAIGAIRTDLPQDLLVAWMGGLDLVTDHWLAEHLVQIDDRVIDGFTQLTLDTLHRLFDPPAPGQEVVLGLQESDEKGAQR